MSKHEKSDILSMREAAKYLNKTYHALANNYKKWGLPWFRLGGQIKFRRSSLDEWIAKQEQAEADALVADAKRDRGEE